MHLFRVEGAHVLASKVLQVVPGRLPRFSDAGCCQALKMKSAIWWTSALEGVRCRLDDSRAHGHIQLVGLPLCCKALNNTILNPNSEKPAEP